MAMLTAQDVRFQFEYPDEAPVLVLDGIDLTVEKGSFVALLGHNGSGKSTLAKHFNALLLPTGGQVWVEDIATTDESRLYDIRRRVGMVLQNPDNQLVSTIVEEDVAFGPENLGVEPAEIRQRVDTALKLVGMYDYRRHTPHKLSGGQKQRVAIAGVLAMQPDCLVLDEPTAMLDPSGRREVMATLHRLNREQGITVVLITHYMDEAAQCDRVVVVDGGRIILEGTPRQVFSHVQEMKAVGLDVPQVTELIWQLREAGYDLPDDIIFEDECVEAIEKLLEAHHVNH